MSFARSGVAPCVACNGLATHLIKGLPVRLQKPKPLIAAVDDKPPKTPILNFDAGNDMGLPTTGVTNYQSYSLFGFGGCDRLLAMV